MHTPKEKTLVSTRAQFETDCSHILTDSLKLIKDKETTKEVSHSQKISDPDGMAIHIVLEGAILSITDKEGRIVQFSTHLVPEVLGTLLEVEKIFWGGLSSGKV